VKPTGQPRPARRNARIVALVAGLAAAAVALSGCLQAIIPDSRPRSTASPTPDAKGVAAQLLPFYDQTLSWTACGDFDCTMVTAPLDWANPTGGDIQLSVIRQRAVSGTAIGSLLTNPGGPGVSGVKLIRESVDFAVGEPLQQQFDVIGFDPRGVAESTSVRCHDAAEMDAFLFDIAEAPRGSDGWIQERTDSNQAFADACDANSGGILPFITTENAARDMDLLRAVLGDTELHYLGYSYGTHLGATYAELYPERVGGLVLDGAVDPTVSLGRSNAIQGLGFESALRAYMADCMTTPECPFSGTVDEALTDLGTILASVEQSPLRGSDGRLLGADSLQTAIIAALYAEESWPALTAALADVLQGDPGIAFQLADFYLRRAGGQYTANVWEAFWAYNCMDQPRDATAEERAADEALVAAEAPTVAPYWFTPTPCEVWPYPATGTNDPIAAEGSAPIVVVGSTNDPATPYEWAVSLADQLASGVLITRVGEGHTGYNKGNACVDAAVEAYLLQGIVPEDGLRCE